MFQALPMHKKDGPVFAKIFAPQAKFKKNKPKIAFVGAFWKINIKKLRFFLARAPPSKLVYIDTKGAFRKNLGSVSQKWIAQNSTKRGPFGSAGG